MADSMAPVIAWTLLWRNSMGNIRLCQRVTNIHSHTALLVEPHIGHCFLVERPAARIDHKRDHDEVNDSANLAVHVRSLSGSVSKRKNRDRFLMGMLVMYSGKMRMRVKGFGYESARLDGESDAGCCVRHHPYISNPDNS